MKYNYNQKYQIKFLRDELTDMVFYSYLFRKTSKDQMRENFRNLAKTESEHANFWGNELKKSSDIDINKIHYHKFKYFVMKIIYNIIGKSLIINVLEHGEYGSIIKYKEYLDSYKEDDSYKQKVNELITQEMEHEDIFAKRISTNTNTVQKSRDFLYGMSDGLVEILATLAGLTAIITSNIDIALSGIVVGLSGTFSMTLGSYLAQKSESEYKISILNRKNIFTKSREINRLIDKYSQEASNSALNTAISYIIGAAIPILPFVFFTKYEAVVISIIAVGIAQGISNSIVALSLNTPILKTAIRSAFLALGAAGLTFLAGEIFHIIFHISLL